MTIAAYASLGEEDDSFFSIIELPFIFQQPLQPQWLMPSEYPAFKLPETK